MSAAVEAAAKAIHGLTEQDPLDEYHPTHQEIMHRTATVALTAALPHLTEGLAELIGNAIEDPERTEPYDVVAARAITEELNRRIQDV